MSTLAQVFRNPRNVSSFGKTSHRDGRSSCNQRIKKGKLLAFISGQQACPGPRPRTQAFCSAYDLVGLISTSPATTASFLPCLPRSSFPEFRDHTLYTSQALTKQSESYIVQTILNHVLGIVSLLLRPVPLSCPPKKEKEEQEQEQAPSPGTTPARKLNCREPPSPARS